MAGDSVPRGQSGHPDQPLSNSVEPEYRARILVEVVLCPGEDRGRKRGDDWDLNAVLDACNVKGYLEDPDIQTEIDEAGSRGRIIGAWVQDVRRVGFADPLPLEDLLAGELRRRIQESRS